MTSEKQKIYNEGFAFFTPDKFDTDWQCPYSWETQEKLARWFSDGFYDAEKAYFKKKYRVEEFYEKQEALIKECGLKVHHSFDGSYLMTPEGYWFGLSK